MLWALKVPTIHQVVRRQFERLAYTPVISVLVRLKQENQMGYAVSLRAALCYLAREKQSQKKSDFFPLMFINLND
jgi:hypothetical protein